MTGPIITFQGPLGPRAQFIGTAMNDERAGIERETTFKQGCAAIALPRHRAPFILAALVLGPGFFMMDAPRDDSGRFDAMGLLSMTERRPAGGVSAALQRAQLVTARALGRSGFTRVRTRRQPVPVAVRASCAAIAAVDRAKGASLTRTPPCWRRAR